MKNYAFVLLFIFFANPHALSQTSAGDIHQASDEDSFAHKKNDQLLKGLKSLTSTRELSAARVVDLFGWPAAETTTTSDGKTKKTRFNLYLSDTKINPSLEQTENSSILRIPIRPDYVCLRSEDVIAEFGSKYKSQIALYDPYPSKISPSARKNQDAFLAGPIYQFNHQGLKTNLSFTFDFSDCATHIGIYEPKHYGANK